MCGCTVGPQASALLPTSSESVTTPFAWQSTHLFPLNAHTTCNAAFSFRHHFIHLLLLHRIPSYSGQSSTTLFNSLLLLFAASQDVFDAGLVVGDTDFRQLSYRHMGALPGLDIAYLLDGAVYHTNRDSLERLRTGVVQVGGWGGGGGGVVGWVGVCGGR
jgi:hypothetical protein